MLLYSSTKYPWIRQRVSTWVLIYKPNWQINGQPQCLHKFLQNFHQTAPSAWKFPKTQSWHLLINCKFGPSLHSYPIINMQTYKTSQPPPPHQKKNKSDTSYLKTSQGLQHSNPLNSSTGSHSLFVSDSVGITSSCSLLAFPLLVSLASLCLHCLCFSVSI